MAIASGTVRIALGTAIAQLRDLNLGTSGERHRNLAEGLHAALRYIDQQEAELGKLLETETLRDGIAIQRAIEDAGIDGAIRQLNAAEGARAAIYRVEIAAMATIEGTVDQLVALLTLMKQAG